MSTTWVYALHSGRRGGEVSIDIADLISATSQASLKNVLAAIRGKAPTTIDVLINSSGGSVTEAESIKAALRASGARVRVKIAGICASAGTIISDAGDSVEITSGSLMMIHSSRTTKGGTATQLERDIATLSRVDEGMLNMYVKAAERRGSRKGEKDFREAMSGERWFSAAEAVEWGLADKVVEDDRQVAAQADLSLVPELARHGEQAFTGSGHLGRITL